MQKEPDIGTRSGLDRLLVAENPGISLDLRGGNVEVNRSTVLQRLSRRKQIELVSTTVVV